MGKFKIRYRGEGKYWAVSKAHIFSQREDSTTGNVSTIVTLSHAVPFFSRGPETPT